MGRRLGARRGLSDGRGEFVSDGSSFGLLGAGAFLIALLLSSLSGPLDGPHQRVHGFLNLFSIVCRQFEMLHALALRPLLRQLFVDFPQVWFRLQHICLVSNQHELATSNFSAISLAHPNIHVRLVRDVLEAVQTGDIVE